MSFSVKNTTVEISFWFAVVMTFLLLFMGNDSAVCFVLCILHEIGHLVSMFAFKSTPKKLELGFFGIKIVTGNRILSPVKEIITAAAGPLVNLLLAVVLCLFDRKSWAAMSVGLAVFNLLPVPMLDGGRILSNILTNGKIIRYIGLSLSVCLFFLGLLVAIETKQNFTILVVSLYLLTGVLIQR